MKVVNENNGGVSPMAGCVCSSGSKTTRGLIPPIINCKCNCIGFGSETSSANANLASKA